MFLKPVDQNHLREMSGLILINIFKQLKMFDFDSQID